MAALASTTKKGALLDALGITARQEIDLAQGAARAALKHAINAGEALARAQAQLPRGDWLRWLETHDIAKTTAIAYMRIAEFREELPSDVGPTQAMEYLSGAGLRRGGASPRYGQALNGKVAALAAEGHSKSEIGRRLGVDTATVRRRLERPTTGLMRTRSRDPDNPQRGINAFMIEGAAIWLCDGHRERVDDEMRGEAEMLLRAAYAFRGPLG